MAAAAPSRLETRFLRETRFLGGKLYHYLATGTVESVRVKCYRPECTTDRATEQEPQATQLPHAFPVRLHPYRNSDARCGDAARFVSGSSGCPAANARRPA